MLVMGLVNTLLHGLVVCQIAKVDKDGEDIVSAHDYICLSYSLSTFDDNITFKSYSAWA